MEGIEDKDIEQIFKKIFPFIATRVSESFTHVIKRAHFFVSYNDLCKYIFIMLEDHVSLDEKIKAELEDALRKIYTTSHTPIDARKLTIVDTRAISYAVKLHDFYFGKFFQGDRDIRLRALKWMSDYYLKEGNPIGKGQKGIKEFMDAFGDYIKPQIEWKARQIIDTSVNYLRNAARLRAMQKAKITHYRWDAIGDRLTCPACRSMDGRVFKVRDAIRILDAIEQSEDPAILKELKPIQTTVQKGLSSSLPNRFPPLHPHCRCRVHMETEEITMQTVVERPQGAKDTLEQRELEEFYKALSPKERENRIKAHMGADWLRPERGINSYKEAKNNFKRKYTRHGKEIGAKSEDEFKRFSYQVIKNPDEVYIEVKKGKTFYVFKKDDIIVISNDDFLKIDNMYKVEDFEERWLKGFKRDGIIKIY